MISIKTQAVKYTPKSFTLCFYRTNMIQRATGIRRRVDDSHPSDNTNVKMPDFNDGSDFINPKFSEYFQIRRLLRSQSEEHLMRTQRDIYYQKYVDSVYKNAYVPLKKGTDSHELDSGRVDTFGFNDENIGKELAIGSRKAHRKREFVIASKSDKYFDTPPIIVSKLHSLQEYCGVHRPEDYTTMLRKLFLKCRFLAESERRQHDQKLKAKQKIQLEKFDSDSEKLIDDVGRIHKIIKDDNEKINDDFVQQSLQKQYNLKILFASKDAKGDVDKNYSLIGQSKNKGDKENLENVKEAVYEDINTHIKGENSKVENQLNEEFISLSVAFELLSEDSILQLIEDLRNTIVDVHESLLMESYKGKIETFENGFQSKSYLKSRDIYLYRIKDNRLYDPAVRLRHDLTDVYATRQQRLQRSLYDRIYENTMLQRYDHLSNISFRKADFGLENVGAITLMTRSHYEVGLSNKHRHKKSSERFVKLRVNTKALGLNSEELRALRLICPKQFSNKNKQFSLVSDNYPTREQNEINVMKKLANIIREVKIYVKVPQCDNQDQYKKKSAKVAQEYSFKTKKSFCKQNISGFSANYLNSLKRDQNQYQQNSAE